MLGVNLNIKDQLRGFFDASVTGALTGSIPYYNQIAAYVRRISTEKNLHKAKEKNEKNTIEDDEYKLGKKLILKELGGSWNPITVVWRFVRSMFGVSKADRLQDAIGLLDPKKYESFRYTDRVLNLYLKELNKRISDKEGWLSKLGLKTNKKVNEDPVVQSLKQQINAWWQPYMDLIHGSIPSYGFTKFDWDTVNSMLTNMRYGSKSKYMQDLVPNAEQVVNEAKTSYQKRLQQQNLAQAA